MMASVSRPPLMTKFTATSSAIIAMIGQTPYLKKLADATPSATQNTTRNDVEPNPPAMPAPRISTAVSANPTMPENIGVKPSKSMNTSTSSGSIRYHLVRIACHGFGHSAFGIPCRPLRPASRCTIANAVR